jgi:nucleoside-diphosphate-sugar epimerase
MNYLWGNKRVFVSGCASLIGSHLCERLISHGATVVGVDNLSSGKMTNILQCIVDGLIFFEEDLFNRAARAHIRDCDVVFHLAADHGGRGYVAKQQWLCSTNLALDNLVFQSCVEYGVKQIVFASSGCVYPNYMQDDTSEELYLRENLVPSLNNGHLGDGYDSDGMYGWAKLMSEFTLQAIHREFGTSTASCRYFTVYGPRAKEDHAVMAMIARAYTHQDPFEIWGDGSQIRNWTYIDDIITGTLLVAETISDGSAINIGTMERTTVEQAALMISGMMGYSPKFRHLLDRPTGPMNRVASNKFIYQLTGWRPSTTFPVGVRKTIDWYKNYRTIEEARRIITDGSLIEGNHR